ncbi:single-stranded-DNA-specific exonuclease RecJ [Acidithiobacillus thiooxidans]|uniref:single-stranded-DNA-specific exonuclease RecJ n=1 Tax=Acidithiobacillus thiooxidans TaxID=930 RepID=UPI0034A3B9FA
MNATVKKTRPDLVRRLLLARGADPEDTLRLDTLFSPLGKQQMLGMREAIQWIAYAAQARWPVLIVGDYDVDGAAATAILRKGLGPLFPLRSLVPNRLTEGYGLSESVADRIGSDIRMVITVDNGIAAHAGIARLKARGITVIVTDHHLPGATRPPADVIVDPNQPGCPFPFKSTCGAGVAWYLLWGLHQTYGEQWVSKEKVLYDTLDLVALATVADLVPLERNNRILVANGLKKIRAGQVNPGLSGLMMHAGVDLEHITEQDFGFRLGPRLNAAGRLADIQTGINLLLSQDAENIAHWSSMLEGINAQRKEIQSQMERQAQEIVDQTGDQGDPVICVGSDAWHSGVVGIVASKLKELYQRPAFVLTATGDVGQTAQGSGRSMPNWHLRDALARVESQHPDLMHKYGGHAMAAGLSFPKNRYEEFRRAINQVAMEQVKGQFAVNLWDDGALSGDELTVEMAKAIEEAGPWGQGFPAPVFVNDFVVESSKTLRGGHWKLVVNLVEPEAVGLAVRVQACRLQACRLQAIHFLDGKEVASSPPPPGFRIRTRYHLQVNRWRGEENLQLHMEQIWPAPQPVAMPSAESVSRSDEQSGLDQQGSFPPAFSPG